MYDKRYKAGSRQYIIIALYHPLYVVLMSEIINVIDGETLEKNYPVLLL